MKHYTKEQSDKALNYLLQLWQTVIVTNKYLNPETQKLFNCKEPQFYASYNDLNNYVKKMVRYFKKIDESKTLPEWRLEAYKAVKIYQGYINQINNIKELTHAEILEIKNNDVDFFDFWKQNRLDKHFRLNIKAIKNCFKTFIEAQPIEWLEKYNYLSVAFFITSNQEHCLDSTAELEDIEILTNKLTPILNDHFKNKR